MNMIVFFKFYKVIEFTKWRLLKFFGNTHTRCSQTVITFHLCSITAGFMTKRAKVINSSPNPKCISRHEGTACLASCPLHPCHCLCFMDQRLFVWFGLPYPLWSSFPPTFLHLHRSFLTGRSRSGIQKSQTPMQGFSTSASGALASGWMW